MGVGGDRRNIVLVSFDDAVAYWRYKTAFGEPLLTPNLDRLCAVSTAFHAAYCQVPICAPSRASFMTGRTPHDLNLFDKDADVFDAVGPQGIWSTRLKAAGYYCSSGGKVHHRYKPLPLALHTQLYDDTQKFFRSDMSMQPDAPREKFGGHRGGWGTTDPANDALYYDHQSADSFVDFIQGYDGDAPFYREVGFYSPHGPHYTPSRFKQMYDVGRFARPADWQDGHDDTAYSAANFPPNPKLNKGKWWKWSVRNYFAALSHGDYHFGRVWDALQASPHAANTVVLIVSDHGFHLGNRGRFRKATLWEQVAGVPMIVHDPASPVARAVHDSVAVIDVGPTALDYAGLPPLTGCMGRSLRAQIGGATDPDRVVPTLRYGNASIRKGRYRIIRYEDGSTQFYDVMSDYWQLRDLGDGHPDFAGLYAAMVDCCRTYGLEIPPHGPAGPTTARPDDADD